ncbi:MAG: ABC transporter substrate-binding protein [Rhodospirillales bacterium]
MLLWNDLKEGARRVSAAIFLISAMIMIAVPVAADQTVQTVPRSPKAVVEYLHAALLDAMKNAAKLGIKGRFESLAPKVAEAYDLNRWIRLATGQYWSKANEQQKEQLKSAFQKMSAATYASQFDGYDGESFKTVKETPGPRDTILVQTQIVRNGKEPVGLTYVMIEGDDRWRIVDILLDNKISQLSVRRSEYRSLLQQSGIDGLISKLKEITGKLLAPA